MTNDIPISLFIFFAVVDFVTIAVSYRDIEDPRPIQVITSVFSAFLSFILANSIINGTVYELAEESTTYVLVPVQSQPLNLIFLAAGITMSVTATAYIFMVIKNHVQAAEKSALGEWQ